jgi:hypothetical protein
MSTIKYGDEIYLSISPSSILQNKRWNFWSQKLNGVPIELDTNKFDTYSIYQNSDGPFLENIPVDINSAMYIKNITANNGYMGTPGPTSSSISMYAAQYAIPVMFENVNEEDESNELSYDKPYRIYVDKFSSKQYFFGNIADYPDFTLIQLTTIGDPQTFIIGKPYKWTCSPSLLSCSEVTVDGDFETEDECNLICNKPTPEPSPSPTPPTPPTPPDSDSNNTLIIILATVIPIICIILIIGIVYYIYYKPKITPAITMSPYNFPETNEYPSQ